MANDDFRRGLVPLNLDWSKGVTYYKAGTSADIFLGLPVALNTNGLCVAIDVASAGATRSIGVAVGFQNGAPGGGNSPGGGLATNDPFLDVSDLGSDPEPYVAVTDNPHQEYLIQEDTGGTALNQSAIGNAASMLFVGTGSGNTDSGWANLELDRSTIAATISGPIMILRPYDVRNTDGTINTTGNYCKWVVRLLHHQKAGGETNVTV